MSIYERVDRLRDIMREKGLEAYIVPTSDPHQSEYLPNFYKTREFISGFTGSAGTAVITLKEAGLWTDGRYFTQADKELQNSSFKLYKMGIDIDYIEFINQEVSEFGKVGLDGTCFSLTQYNTLAEKLGDRLIRTDFDLISDIWTQNRPKLPKEEIYILGEEYTGQSVEEKLNILRAMMRHREVDYVYIGASEDIAYLYNLRGNDITATPVFLSFAIITEDKAHLFVDMEKLTSEVDQYLNEKNIQVHNYDDIYQFIKKIPGKSVVYLDPERTNVLAYQSLNRNVRVKKGINLTSLMKALKNPTEIKNFNNAFEKDAAALVKFFNWVESGASTGNIDEIMASNKLLEFRQQQDGFLDFSFETISAYGSNAAMPHYDPHKAKPATLKKKGLYLVDSGGQYIDGTTDITRVISLGEMTEDEKTHYTLTLKAHIAAITSKFLKGTTGQYIDSVTRYPINKAGLDFNHGTGHGIGFVLGVHEGPMSISRKDRGISLEEGMVFSIEPGIYIEGSHGIRIENIVHVVKSETENYYELECFSYVPIDTRPIQRYMLEEWEVEWLNNYHNLCRQKLENRLSEEEKEYLYKMTESI